MPDQYLYEILLPYGRVLSIEHLKVKGFQNIKSGTRQVSMVITKSIPAIIKISNIQLSFHYRRQPPFCFVCQEVGHTGRDYPKSRRAHRNTLNADLDPEDLHHKLHKVKENDLQVKLNNSKQVSQVPQDDPAATSSPSSIITADQPQKSGISNKSNSDNKDKPKPNNNNDNAKDQPISTFNTSASSSSSPSSSTLHDTMSKLTKVFKMPSKINTIANSVAVPSFESLLQRRALHLSVIQRLQDFAPAF